MAAAGISVTMRVRRCGRRNEEGGGDFAAGATWELEVKEPGPHSLSIGAQQRPQRVLLGLGAKRSSWSVEIEAGLVMTCCQRCHRCLDHSPGRPKLPAPDTYLRGLGGITRPDCHGSINASNATGQAQGQSSSSPHSEFRQRGGNAELSTNSSGRHSTPRSFVHAFFFWLRLCPQVPEQRAAGRVWLRGAAVLITRRASNGTERG